MERRKKEEIEWEEEGEGRRERGREDMEKKSDSVQKVAGVIKV